MSARRIWTGAAVAAAGLTLWAGPVAAQVGCPYSPEGCPEQEAPGGVEQPGGGVAPGAAEQPEGEGFEVGAGGAAAGDAAAGGSSLPVTGGDIAGMVVLGGAAVAGGTVLVRRTRRA